MNNEFKKTANKNQTVYTLESATAGSSSSSVNATVSSPMGGVRKRGGNLIAQESDKKVPATTPRNFVAKNAKTGGAGAHKDKKKAEKQGSAKHKKPYMEALQARLDQLKSKVEEGSEYKSRHAHKQEQDKAYADYRTKHNTSSMALMTRAEFAKDQRERAAKKKQGVAEGSLEEVSQDTARSYAQKARASQKDLLNQTHRKGADTDALNKKIKNRQQGMDRAHTDKRYYKDEQGVAEVFADQGAGSTARDNAEYMKRRNAAGSEIKIPTEDGITMQDIRLMAGEGPLTKKTVLQAIAVIRKQRRPQGVAEAEQRMSRAAKGNEKYGKDGMKALAKAGRDGAGEKKLDAIRDKHDNYNEDFNGEYDDEAGMAQSNLHTMARAVKGLIDTIDSNDNLPEWCQEKIAKAEMMVTGVWDYLLSQKEQGMDPEQGVAEGAKVDRQAKHITASMMKKGKSKKDAESIAWAHIKHPKNESVDPYFESLQTMVERQLEPTMDLDTWNDNFQNADPQKYHQFKNKSPEKKK